MSEEQKESNRGVLAPRVVHNRFNKSVWAFKKDFTGALAKWLVKQSPYSVPDNLGLIIEDFHNRIPYDFDKNGMAFVSLASMTHIINEVLETMPMVMALNERKNGNTGMSFISRDSPEPEPDDDFICIMAVAQNITCEFADREDAQSWLDMGRSCHTVPPPPYNHIQSEEESTAEIRHILEVAGRSIPWLPNNGCDDLVNTIAFMEPIFNG